MTDKHISQRECVCWLKWKSITYIKTYFEEIQQMDYLVVTKMMFFIVHSL